MMAQYCRYCAFCCYGDVAYCTMYDRAMSDASMKRANHCSEFALSDLGDVESGKPYQPRRKREKGDAVQIQLEL